MPVCIVGMPVWGTMPCGITGDLRMRAVLQEQFDQLISPIAHVPMEQRPTYRYHADRTRAPRARASVCVRARECVCVCVPA